MLISESIVRYLGLAFFFHCHKMAVHSNFRIQFTHGNFRSVNLIFNYLFLMSGHLDSAKGVEPNCTGILHEQLQFCGGEVQGIHSAGCCVAWSWCGEELYNGKHILWLRSGKIQGERENCISCLYYAKNILLQFKFWCPISHKL